MPETVSIKNPQLLQLTEGDTVSFGGRQRWYPTRYSRKRGCGPTTAANLCWYLAATRPECEALAPPKSAAVQGMTELMYRVYSFVKPSPAGIFRPDRFAWGASRYGAACGVWLRARILPVSVGKAARPDEDTLRDFLFSALESDLPVAFLNRSNGKAEHLHGWHWVTVVAVDSDLSAEIYDQSRRERVDLRSWLEQTRLGGAFVVLQPMDLEKIDLAPDAETM